MSRIAVRRLVEGEWALFRDIRLRALADSPQAFSSTAAEAEQLREGEWRRRLTERAAFVASAGAELVGMVCGVGTEVPDAAELISMWVDPGWRSRGVGGQLVNTVIDWAGRQGFQRLCLWVAEGNATAERLYAACGFRRTGEVQPMPRGDRMEFAMAAALRVQRLDSRPRETRARRIGG